MFMATGEPQFADLIERATFNALPGAVTKDFKQLQYFSAVNQIVIAATNSHTRRWPTRMTYRAAHDTECCAGNINRAMPNYVIRMWMRSGDDGLAAVYYGPSEVTAPVNGQNVTITEETDSVKISRSGASISGKDSDTLFPDKIGFHLPKGNVRSLDLHFTSSFPVDQKRSIRQGFDDHIGKKFFAAEERKEVFQRLGNK